MPPSKSSLDRRSFLQLAGAGALAAASPALADSVSPDLPVSPSSLSRPSGIAAYGYDKLYDASEPYVLAPGPHLFLDWRDVHPGGIGWQDADGKPIHYFANKEPVGVTWRQNRAAMGIKLVNEKAARIGPVIPNDRDWEYCLYSYISLFDFGGKFGMFYEVVPPGEMDNKDLMGSHQDLLCYAESTDGINWTKPELNLVEFKGSKKNNIVVDLGQSFYKTGHGMNVWLDPSAPPDQRFKLVFMSFPPGEEIFTKFQQEHPLSVTRWGKKKHSVIQFATSSDGFKWNFNDKIAMQHMSDTETICYYDEFLKRYVGYFRMSVMGRRSIGRSETADLYSWPTPEACLDSHGEDDPCLDYYNNSRCMYPGSKTAHIMFPTTYHRFTESCTLRMATSLDGISWHWVPGGDVVDYGVAPGQWDAECIFGGCGLVEIPDGRVIFPFTAYQFAHKYPRFPRAGQIGLASWKKERLCALIAEEDGAFHTHAMLLPGQSLYLNYQTRQAGSIKVKVLGTDGRTLDDCDVLSGDQIKQQVTWKGESSLKVPDGKPATFHFSLRAAKLYSFEVK